MKVSLIVVAASGLLQLASSLCFQCPLNCSCSLEETVCSDLSEIPQCLPYSSKSVKVSSSPYLTVITSNAFADESYGNLQEITISGAGLRDIEDFAFNGTRQLQKVEITNTYGPLVLNRYSLHGLDHLLSFEASRIENLQSIGYRTFSATPNLKTLKLQQNNIKFIDAEALESVSGLEYFDISYNPYLGSIPQSLLSQISTLRTIYMNDCSLTTMHTDYVYASYMTNALDEFRANGNNWDCGEEMCSFIKWIGDHSDILSMAIFGYCQTPVLLFGYPLRDLDSTDVCDSSDPSDTFYMYATIATASIILLAICSSIYRRRRNLCCSRCCNQGYIDIDDTHFDINAHDRAAALCPNPPNYEAVVAASRPPKPDDELPLYDDVIAPPDYNE